MLGIAGDIPGYEKATAPSSRTIPSGWNSVLRHGPKTFGLMPSAWPTQHLNASIRATAEEDCIPVGWSAIRPLLLSNVRVAG
jgi:uncharacterized protein YbdZ (MbtH family)